MNEDNKTPESILKDIADKKDNESILKDIESVGIATLIEGRNFLYYAAKAGNIDLCQRLIEAKLSPREGVEPALFGAIRSGDSRVVEFMLNNGSVLSQRSHAYPHLSFRDVVLEVADEAKRGEILGVLESYSNAKSEQSRGAALVNPSAHRALLEEVHQKQ